MEHVDAFGPLPRWQDPIRGSRPHLSGPVIRRCNTQLPEAPGGCKDISVIRIHWYFSRIQWNIFLVLRSPQLVPDLCLPLPLGWKEGE